MSRNVRLANVIESNGQETAWTKNLAATTTTDDLLYKGVGSAINEKVSESDVPHLLKQAKLDWKVEVAKGVKFGPDFKYESKLAQVIYRQNPDVPGEVIHLGTTSPRWQPFQNDQVVTSFVLFCEKSQLTMERLGALDQGRIIFAVARTDETFVLPGGDIVQGKLLLTNAHKSGRGARVDLMAPRLVCTNQLVLPVKVAGQVIAHTSSYSEEKITRILEAAKTGFSKFQKDAEFLSSTPVEDSVAHTLIVRILGDKDKSLDEQPKAVQAVLKLYHGEGKGSELLSSYHTAWGVTQAVTEYYSHHSSQRGGSSGHINSLWLGNKRAKSEQALRQVVSAFR